MKVIPWKRPYDELGGTVEEWLFVNYPHTTNSDMLDVLEPLIGFRPKKRALRDRAMQLGVRKSDESYGNAWKKDRVRVSGSSFPKMEGDIEEIWSLVEKYSQHLRNSQPRQEVTIRINVDRPIGVAFPADLHIGGMGTDHASIKRDMEAIANCEWLYCYVGGDNVENFILQALISAGLNQSATVTTQWELLWYILGILEDSMLAIGIGNHEYWANKLAQVDRLAEWARRRRVVYTKHGGLLNLYVGQQLYKIVRRHKYKYESSFNLGHAVKRMYDMGACPFDVGVVEHKHVPHLEEFQRHGETRLAIRPGTYEVFSEYALEKGLYGAKISVPVVVFSNTERKMTPFSNLQDAIAFLSI